MHRITTRYLGSPVIILIVSSILNGCTLIGVGIGTGEGPKTFDLPLVSAVALESQGEVRLFPFIEIKHVNKPGSKHAAAVGFLIGATIDALIIYWIRREFRAY